MFDLYAIHQKVHILFSNDMISPALGQTPGTHMYSNFKFSSLSLISHMIYVLGELI